MRTQTKVVVIGGGIAGCSTLYHLTQEGITDCMLLERDELTSGTTWHSAAQVTNFGMNQVMIGLKKHSIALYRDLAADPDYPVGYHHGDGGIRLANTQEQMDAYRHFASVARGMGVTFEVIDAEECKRRHPLISTDNLVGGLWDPEDGDIDPAQLCQALARRARLAGAEVNRHTAVTGLTQHPDHSWTVHTDKGDITAEIVVNAGGYRVNEIGAMIGVEHPVMSMEHQYFVTETIPEIAEAGHRMPLLRCPISDYYCRQEKQGLLLGFYEQGCKTWGMDGIDPHFANALCPDDLDRVTDVLEGAFARMPTLQEVGIHTIVNGPITYSMDGAPLVGAIPGKQNAYCIIGLRAGVGEGGGHGWLLAQIIAHGEACYDTWALDPRRFTGHANVELTALKAIEDYQNEFRFHYPHEHRPAGRGAKTTPLTAKLADQNAHFGVVNGWERVEYFKPSPDFVEDHTFRFTNAEPVIAAEVKALSSGVGLAEINGFNRIEFTAESTISDLSGLICGRLPKQGKVGLCYLLNEHGCIKAEATLARLPDGRVWYGSAAASEWHDRDWLKQHLPEATARTMRSRTDDHQILLLAGPKARDALARVTRDDWSDASAPWLSVRQTCIGIVPAVIMRVSYSGELAYELHVPTHQMSYVYDLLRDAVPEMTQFGARAVESMRIEKGYLHWKADLITEFDPFETGLDRFVKMDKDFVGKTALQERQQNRRSKQLVLMELHSDLAPAHGGASVMSGDTVIGSVSSAAYGHRTSKNLALAFVDPAFSPVGSAFEVDVIGQRLAAEVIAPPL